jgi:DNA replication initiation complex subunit (GINS family)
MLDKRTVKGRAMLKEEENAKRLIEDLTRTRLEKIIHAVMEEGAISTTILSEEETSLYENLASEIESYRSLVKKVLRGQKPEVGRRTARKGMIVVRILKDVPAIIGADMKTYGPFKPEDVAALPQENARLLIKQGVATEIETV